MSSIGSMSFRDIWVETVPNTNQTDKEKNNHNTIDSSTFHWPMGLALTPQGDLLVCNYLGHNIRSIDKNGMISTFAGTGQQGFLNGHKESATFSGPSSIAITSQGDILVTDVLNNCIRMVSRHGEVTTYAGSGLQGFKNGPKETATFFYPFSLVRTPQGQTLVLDKGNHSIRLISADGVVSTFAGCGQAGCKDGQRQEAMFNTPYGMCLVPSTIPFRSSHHLASNIQPELYVADSGNHRICFINQDSLVTTFAGISGQAGFIDGHKDSIAKFHGPRAVILTPHGDLLVSDQGNRRIRIVETNGLVSTFAGCEFGGCQDGPRERATFSSPSGLVLSPSGDLYISDFTNNRIRHIKCPMWDQQSAKQHKMDSKFNLAPLIADDAPQILSDFSIILNQQTKKLHFKETCISEVLPNTDAEAQSGSKIIDELSSAASSLSVFDYTWNLHKIILYQRCPALFEQEVLSKLKTAKVSKEAIDALVMFIYEDQLPEQLSLFHLCDFDLILLICKLHELSQYVRAIIFQKLRDESSLEDQISLLGHIANQGPIRQQLGDNQLVDFVVSRLRKERSKVANHVEDIFAKLSQNQALLISVMSKLLGDGNLSTISRTVSRSSLYLEHDIPPFGRLPEQVESIYNLLRQDTSQVTASDSEVKSNSLTNLSPAAPLPHYLEPDFIIEVEVQSLKCHKSILYARWPYFAKAIKLGGMEMMQAKLVLPPDTFSPSLVQALLEYFYCSKLSGIESDEDCLDILKHSMMFGFVDNENDPEPGFEILITHCRRPLVKPLSPTNCIKVLSAVLKYGNSHQQHKVRSFVARVLPDIMNNDQLVDELEALGPAENMKILFEQYGRLPGTSSPLKLRQPTL